MKRTISWGLIFLILVTMALMVASCSTQKRCARFVARHPECFQSTDSTRTDTIVRELTQWDTVIHNTHDTVRIQTPCGELVVTHDSTGGLKISQKPRYIEIKTTETKTVQLPCPCDCKSKDREIKNLKQQSRQSRWKVPWWWIFGGIVAGFVLGRQKIL